MLRLPLHSTTEHRADANVDDNGNDDGNG